MAEIDYRAICLELFGTDDVEQLKMIAKQIRQKNTRNAGRKRKFNEAETEEMKRLQRAGMTVNDIARRFGTSRQIIGKYLNAPLPEGYTMRMTYMFRRQPWRWWKCAPRRLGGYPLVQSPKIQSGAYQLMPLII